MLLIRGQGRRELVPFSSQAHGGTMAINVIAPARVKKCERGAAFQPVSTVVRRAHNAKQRGLVCRT